MLDAEKPLVTFALLTALAAAPAAAQLDRDAQFNSAVAQARSAISLNVAEAAMPKVLGASRKAQASPESMLQSVLVAMNDGPATAGLLVSWLRENKAGIEFKSPSSHAWNGSKATVYLDPSLAAEPVSYRYMAVFAARETTELMLKDFPESAEKRYIVSSRMAETFFELGGTRMTMGDIDGHKDAEAEKAIRLWVENDPVGGVSYLKSQGVATLAQVRAKAVFEAERLGNLKHIIEDQMLVVPGDPNAPSLRAEADQCGVDREKALQTVAAVDAALKQFETFKTQEKDWLWSNQGMLQ